MRIDQKCKGDMVFIPGHPYVYMVGSKSEFSDNIRLLHPTGQFALLVRSGVMVPDISPKYRVGQMISVKGAAATKIRDIRFDGDLLTYDIGISRVITEDQILCGVCAMSEQFN